MQGLESGNDSMKMILAQPIQWEKTADAEYPFTSVVDGVCYRIRLNDFPAERMYTLLVGKDEKIIDFDEWPPAWRR